MNSRHLALPLVAAVALLVVSISLLNKEWRSLVDGNGASITRFFGLDGSAFNVRASIRLPGYVDCLQAHGAEPQANYAACIALLKASLRQAPADGDAWYELARLEYLQAGLQSQALAALEQSYASAPFELWISRRRLPFALSVWENLPDALRCRANQEVERLAGSRDGATALSALYLRMPDQAQAVLRDQLESLPQAAKRRFLNAVQRTLRSPG